MCLSHDHAAHRSSTTRSAELCWDSFCDRRPLRDMAAVPVSAPASLEAIDNRQKSFAELVLVHLSVHLSALRWTSPIAAVFHDLHLIAGSPVQRQTVTKHPAACMMPSPKYHYAVIPPMHGKQLASVLVLCRQLRTQPALEPNSQNFHIPNAHAQSRVVALLCFSVLLDYRETCSRLDATSFDAQLASDDARTGE
ncbi:hypothetical protein C8Q80DRAFT_883751 [Daedaleopsis nitida]|nr:hypothetical protein C8Q80DRAFT_883751 [Daedaleopsis nitida]